MTAGFDTYWLRHLAQAVGDAFTCRIRWKPDPPVNSKALGCLFL